jgi:hypothetical protein
VGWCLYLLNAILDHVWSDTSFNMPATIYLGLAINVAANGNITGEPAAVNNYARVAITQNAAIFPAAVAGSKTAPNAATWTFNQANNSWGTVNVFFFSDTSTIAANVNTLAWGQLTVNKTIGSGDTPYFAANDVTLNIV